MRTDKGCPFVLVNCGVGGGIAREDVVSRKDLAVSFCLGYGRRDGRLGHQSEASHDGEDAPKPVDCDRAVEGRAEREERVGARRGTNLWQLDLGPRMTGVVGQ